MKQRVSRDAAHTFPAFARKYSRGGFPFSWWFTARTCLGRCRSHNGESCRRRSPADTVITGWHLPGRDHNDNGRFAGKTSSYTLAVFTGYASTAVLSCTISFGRINRLPLPPLSSFPSSPRAAALFRTESSRYVALVIRYRWRSRRYFLLEAGMHHARLIAAAHDACDAILSIDRETVTLFCRLSLSKKRRKK